MIGIVLAAHDPVGKALIEVATGVIPQASSVQAVEFRPETETAEFRSALEDAIERVDTGRGVIVLTDMFGGSPSNLALGMHREGAVEVITGANLPMLIKALQVSKSEEDLRDAVGQIAAAGRKAISDATLLLSGRS